MSPIVPAIIPTSLAHLKESIDLVAPFTHEVQVDIVDGVFVPFTSWPYVEDAHIADMAALTKEGLVEVDLMLMEPEAVLSEYVRAGARRVVVHLEGVRDFEKILALKKELDFKLGFSINNDTPLEKLTDVITHADYVQLMGIAHIGSQGQLFDERVLERIATLRVAYPTLLISIDGSVNEETVGRLAHAGANRCVSGSAILKQKNPEEAFNTLASLFAIAA
jgi:ribulose-phosphate 3-epimerase